MALLTVEDVKFSSRTQEIIKGVSLEIEKGSTTVLIGKSGCGKSTLLKLLAGILVPSEGRVLFDGHNIETMTNAQNKEFRRRSAFVFQDAALWANQDIYHNLSIPLQVHFPKMSHEERLFAVQGICAMVNYSRPLTLRPVDLSAGEQKRIAFARAMSCGPEILFLDEITASMDRRGMELIMNLLHNFVDQGNTLVYVSHNATFITEFPGNMIYVEDGLLKDEIQN
ncbi:MAG: ATP-binding cassette domain-containing protein [Treponema sp.]|nr:ATP-binding cassette domain-containing protein [Treponema sp.]